jgi:hypothetical protein
LWAVGISAPTACSGHEFSFVSGFAKIVIQGELAVCRRPQILKARLNLGALCVHFSLTQTLDALSSPSAFVRRAAPKALSATQPLLKLTIAIHKSVLGWPGGGCVH